MRFKPSIWYPISVILSALNVASIAFAVGEPWHAMAHGGLAVGFALWAQRLKQRRDQGEAQPAIAAADADRVEVLESDLERMRQDLSEAQERLDFTERMLAQRPPPSREPQR